MLVLLAEDELWWVDSYLGSGRLGYFCIELY
jgi:hypothetical protein